MVIIECLKNLKIEMRKIKEFSELIIILDERRGIGSSVASGRENDYCVTRERDREGERRDLVKGK